MVARGGLAPGRNIGAMKATGEGGGKRIIRAHLAGYV